jgi:hypothetical protein
MPVVATLSFLALTQAPWKPYQLGGFSFLLPTAPVEQKAPANAKDTRIWTSLHANGNVVVVGVSTINDAEALKKPDGVLAAAVAGTLDSQKGSLLSQTDSLLAGWPAVDIRVKTGEGLFGTARTAMVGNKMVQLLVMGKTEAAVKAPYEKAIASLGIGSQAKGTQTVAGPNFTAVPIGASGASIELPRMPKEETFPINTKPDAPVMHRFVATYGNRVYIAAYTDLPGDKAPTDEAEIAKGLQGINDMVVGSLGGKPLPAVDTKLDGVYAIRNLVKMGSNGVARVESTIAGNRLYTLMAIVPAIWQDHPEVKRFFGSFKLKAAAPSG